MALAASRDRVIVLASLGGIAGLAWAYLVGSAADMSGMEGMPMALVAMSFAAACAMWIVMMAGMMLPGAVPMVLLFAAVQRRHSGRPLIATGLFTAGYLLVWSGFAVVAAALQIALGHMALLSPSLAFASTRLTALAFFLAAAYELTPLKGICLAQCHSPVGFVVSHWRPGLTGALRMGVAHGAVCLGCCWVLMLLLFAAGVMNLLWVAALAVLVLLQKIAPSASVSAAATGAVMLAVGLVMLVR